MIRNAVEEGKAALSQPCNSRNPFLERQARCSSGFGGRHTDNVSDPSNPPTLQILTKILAFYNSFIPHLKFQFVST
jgi:hypothetical protein